MSESKKPKKEVPSDASFELQPQNNEQCDMASSLSVEQPESFQVSQRALEYWKHFMCTTEGVLGQWKIIDIAKCSDSGSHTYLRCKCTKCGHEQDIRATVIRCNPEQSTCKGCNLYNGKSIYEQYIIDTLRVYNIKFNREVTFPDLEYKCSLRIDFTMCKDDKIFCIEYNGAQHSDDVKHLISAKRDYTKHKYCYTHNMVLLVIPSTKKECDDIQRIIKAFLNLFNLTDTNDVSDADYNELSDYILLPIDFDTTTLPVEIVAMINNGERTRKFIKNLSIMG
jgi:hypothetical protein